MSLANARSLSFVLPAFNEEGNIVASVRRCVEVATELALEFEVIVVDDGSVDATKVLVDGLAAGDARVRALHHPKNRGYGAALRTGLFAATKDLVFFTDADLQFDVAEVTHLLARAEEAEIVAGYRAPRRDPPLRVFLGWGWSRLVGLTFGLQVRDVDCAFKVFDRRLFDRIPVHSLGAFVNTEILVRARAEGFRLVQVPVTHHPRQHGVQTGARPRVILRALGELLALRRELSELPKRGEAHHTSSD